ncbi:MAG: hypothetical protein J5I91_01540 [Bacteroidetes bacterium]|nr:hypothetical protein [Bacteroidota bacterium]
MKNITISTLKGIALTIFTSFILTPNINAQEQLDLINSNFSAPNAVYLNPANIATPANIAYINLWSRGIGFQNDFMKYNAPFKINKWANGRVPDQYMNYDKVDFKQSWLQPLGLNGNKKDFNFSQDIRALSLMLPVSYNTFISLNLRQRTGIQIMGMDEDLARIARYGINNSKMDLFGTATNQLQYGKSLGTNKGFKAHFESWQEYSFSLGGVMHEDKNHILSGGFTLKYLRGMGAGHLSSSDLKFTVDNGDSITFNSGSVDYAHTSEVAMMRPLLIPLDWFDQVTTGHGVGIDLGINWIKKRNRSSFKHSNFWDWGCDYYQQYDWKLGAALMDLGFIQHGKGVKSYDVDFSSPFGLGVRSGMFTGFGNTYRDGFDDFDNDVINKLPSSTVTEKNTFTTTLPAAFTAQGDFRLGNRTYLGINYQQSIKPTTSHGLNAPNFISFIPRIEGYFAEAALPITVSNTFKTINVGFFAKLWIFHIGSDNLGGLLNLSSNKSFTGASLYGGFSLPVPYCTGGSWFEHKTERKIITYPEEEKPKQKPEEEQKPDSTQVQKPDTVFVMVKDTVPVQDTSWKKKEQEYIAKQKELEKRIDDLEKNKPGVKTDCLDCERNLRNERNENDRIRRDLNYEKDKNNNLQRENITLRDKLRVIEAEKIKCESDRDKNARDLDNLQKKIIAIQKELDDCRKRTAPETSDEEVKRLNIKITQLENEKKELENQRDNCKKTNDDLTVKITQLQNDADKCKKDIEEYKAKVDKLNKENEKLHADITAARDSIIFYQAKVKEIDNSKQLDELNKKIAALEADKKKCNDENAKKDKRIQELSDSLNNINISLRSCKDQYDNALREYQFAIQRVKDLEKQLKDCQDKAKNGDNPNGTDQAQIQDLQKKLNEAQDKVKTLESKIADCENKRVELENNYKKTIESKDKRIQELNDSLNNINISLKSCKDQYDNALREYQFAMQRVKDLEKQLKDCQDKAKNGDNPNGTDQAQIQDLQKKLNEAQDKVKTLESKVSEQESQITTLKKRQEELNQKVQDCEDSKAGNDQSAKIKELETKIADLQSKLNSTQTELTQSKTRQTELEAKIKVCEEEKAKLASNKTSSNEDLDKKVADLENEKKSLQQQLEESKKQAQTKETEISNMKQQVESQKAQLDECKRIQNLYNKAIHDKDSIQRVNIRLENDLRNCQDQKEGQGNVVPGTNNPTENNGTGTTKTNSSSTSSRTSNIPSGINGSNNRNSGQTSQTNRSGNRDNQSSGKTESSGQTNSESGRGGRR